MVMNIYVRGKSTGGFAKVDNVNYIRIIDYKTGNTAFKEKEIDAGLSLQLPLYLNAIIKSQVINQNLII